jgi:hypothetical protein
MIRKKTSWWRISGEIDMKNVKVIVGILFVFSLGVACGALIMHIAYGSRMEAFVSGKPEVREEILLKRLDRRLDLDDRQRDIVRTIIHETATELKSIRNQFRPQMNVVLDKGRAEVRKALRPEQQEKFDKFIAERRARRAAKGD